MFIVEIMGHKVGWLTLHAGIAGGAEHHPHSRDLPYDIDRIIEAIQHRSKEGKGFTILAVAEGAISKEDAALSKKDFKEKAARLQVPPPSPTRSPK